MNVLYVVEAGESALELRAADGVSAEVGVLLINPHEVGVLLVPLHRR